MVSRPDRWKLYNPKFISILLHGCQGATPPYRRQKIMCMEYPWDFQNWMKNCFGAPFRKRNDHRNNEDIFLANDFANRSNKPKIIKL